MNTSELTPGPSRAKSGDITRRQFLKYGAEGTAFLFFKPVDRILNSVLHASPGKNPAERNSKETDLDLYTEWLKSLIPNIHATLTNLPRIQDIYPFKQMRIEPVSETMHTAYNYSKDDKIYPGHLNLNDKNGAFDGYWKGIKEAIDRGQKVYLVIEMPSEKDADINQWREYVAAVGKQFAGATFIIGNEINDESSYWYDKTDSYAERFIAASQVLKAASTKNQVLLYGEAHNENGKTLRKILSAITNKLNRKTPDLSDLIDGLPFHYYDLAGGLKNRVALYQQIAGEFSISQKLHLMELGMGIMEGNTMLMQDVTGQNQKNDLLGQSVIQNLSTALAMPDDIETAVWFTAYYPGETAGYCLTDINPEDGSVTGLKPAFIQAWKISRLLHHDVTMDNSQDGVVIIRGKTSDNKDAVIAWNNDPMIESSYMWRKYLPVEFGGEPASRTLMLDVPQVLDVKLNRTKRPDVEGKPSIFIFDNKQLIAQE